MKLRPFHLAFGAAVTGALGAQVADDEGREVQATFHAFEDAGWDVEPDIDATGHLIFNSVSSLMQLWPNTVWRHGAHDLDCTQAPYSSLACRPYYGAHTYTGRNAVAPRSDHAKRLYTYAT